MSDDLDRTEQRLRSLLTARAADITPKDLHDGVVRRARRHRRTVVAAAATAVALVAAGVPGAIAAVRSDAAPPPPATRPVPELYQCKAGSGAGASRGRPWNDPRIPAQRNVAGSLAADPSAVKAVAQAGWGAMSSYKPQIEAANLRVVAAHQAEDGWIVGLVTGSDVNEHIFMTVRVIGPDLGHLVGLTDGWTEDTTKRLRQRFGTTDVFADVVRDCGPTRAVVAGPPGSPAEITWMTGVAADATIERGGQPLPVRPDGFATVILSAPPQVAGTVRIGRNEPNGSAGFIGSRVPKGPSLAEMQRRLQTAPGNLQDRNLRGALSQEHTVYLPVPQRDVRVLFAGQGAGTGAKMSKAAAAVSTLPSGAQLLWGEMGSYMDGPFGNFVGLIPAGALDRTVYRLTANLSASKPPAPQMVFFTGTREVDITSGGTTRTDTVSGGLVLDGRTSVVVHGPDGTPLPVVDVETLTRPDSPMW